MLCDCSLSYLSLLLSLQLLTSALTGQAKPGPSLPREFVLLAEREIHGDEVIN